MTTLRVPLQRSRSAGKPASERQAEAKRPRPIRAAQMLACAHEMQAMIDRGELRDRTELAARFGFTRARITQLLDLLLLAPDVQEEILLMEVVHGGDPVHEHALRAIVRHASWRDQRAEWRTLRTRGGAPGP